MNNNPAIPAHEQTRSRKEDHLSICLNEDVQSKTTSGWEEIRLPHCALPEVDLQKIDVCTHSLGAKLESPLFISSMTGGSDDGDVINSRLAAFAQHHKIPMGVGSQRILLEKRDSKSFQLREAAPKAILLANIGAVQLNYGVSNEDCAWLVDKIEAKALILHANPMQEAIQAEGDQNFEGLFQKIESLKKHIKVPLILKETGCGLDKKSCSRAISAGVDVLDSAGMGGTHWGFIEGLRSSQRRELGEMFRDWGIPSTEALKNAVDASKNTNTKVFASGGIRTGLDCAKALYEGASLVGMALPFLKAAQQGEESLENFYSTQIEALKIAMLCTGAASIKELREMNQHES